MLWAFCYSTTLSTLRGRTRDALHPDLCDNLPPHEQAKNEPAPKWKEMTWNHGTNKSILYTYINMCMCLVFKRCPV